MSLYKRKSSPNWQYKLYPPGGGSPVQGSTGTRDRAQAQEFHDRLKVDLWNQARLGMKPRYTWNEAVVRYLSEREGLRSLETSKCRLRWLDHHLSGIALADIDRTKIDAIALAKRSEPIVTRTKYYFAETERMPSPGSVLRVLGVLKAVLNAAVEWGWLDRAPVTRRSKHPASRIRWLTHEQAERLLAELPCHLADMARFTLETGLRRSNVTGLMWSQVDIVHRVAWIHADQAKGKKAITVPLSDTAISVLLRQRGARRARGFEDSVFVFRGKPVFATNASAWKKALVRAGIADFRWHDLRHTWASWHLQRGTPIQVLRELGGWSTLAMVQRYAHLAPGHLAQWAAPHTVESAPRLAAI